MTNRLDLSSNDWDRDRSVRPSVSSPSERAAHPQRVSHRC